jgi:hypothetical protein
MVATVIIAGMALGLARPMHLRAVVRSR